MTVNVKTIYKRLPRPVRFRVNAEARMLKLIATVALAATILVVLQGSGACFAAEVSPGSSTNIKAYQSPRASGEMDQGEAMKYCNESFTIKTGNLIALIMMIF